jgi:hypothetical protein
MGEIQATVSINKNSSFTEIFYEGFVEFNKREYNFWLVNPRGLDEQGREYEIEVRWWFKRVPVEVRGMHDQIVEAYYESQNKKQNDKGNE